MPDRAPHVCESTVGGVGVFIRDLSLRQTADGDSVAVAVPRAGRTSTRWVRRRPAVRLERDGAAGPDRAARAGWLSRIVRRVDPEIVHLHSSKAGFAGRLLLRRRRPTVMQPHAWSFFAKTGRVRTATLAWERFGARWADAVLCVSEDERRLGRESGIDADYRVLVNSVALDRFVAPFDGDRAAARSRLGLAAEVPIAVCVGRLHRQKNQAALLAARPGACARPTRG